MDKDEISGKASNFSDLIWLFITDQTSVGFKFKIFPKILAAM